MHVTLQRNKGIYGDILFHQHVAPTYTKVKQNDDVRVRAASEPEAGAFLALSE